MTKFSNKLKNPYFCPIFPIFGAIFFFSKNLALPRTTPQHHAEFQKSSENFQTASTNKWGHKQTDEDIKSTILEN